MRRRSRREAPPAPRRVVITGASSGIGRLTAHAFADRGDHVVLAARTATSLSEAVAECERRGGRALAVPTDVADEAAVHRLLARAVDAFGGVDVWVNNAAVMAYGPFWEVPADVHRRIVEVNLLGPVHGARAVIPLFLRQGAGVLVNVGSLYAKLTSPSVSPYVLSKFGVLGFSEVLRQDVAGAEGGEGVHVCTVLPGSMDTPIFRHSANFAGRGIRPVPPVSDPRRVARAIVGCADRPRREVTVGQTHHLLSWGHALLPGLYERLAPVAMRHAGFTGEEAEDGAGNVFTPMPQWNRVGGGWREGRARRVAAAVGATAAAVPAAVALRQRRR